MKKVNQLFIQKVFDRLRLTMLMKIFIKKNFQ